MVDMNRTGGEPDAGPHGSDPSALTTDALNREVAVLRELIDDKIGERQRATGDLRDLLIAQLNGEVRVLEEKIHSIHSLLEMIEKQRVEQKKDTKDAVDAALAAAKEAVKEQTTASQTAIAKSEGMTDKRLEQLTATFEASIRGVTASLSDVKERVGDLTSMRRGGKEMLAGIYALAGFIVALLVIGGIVAAAGGFSGQ